MSVTLPKAAREQLEVLPWETALTDMARRRHPTIAWWNGYRQTKEGKGTFCYVCDRMIVLWTRKFPITRTAAKAIDEHKFAHWPGLE